MTTNEPLAPQLGNAMRHLLIQHEQWEQICADPALIANTIEEILRFDGSVPIWRRVAKEEVVLSGVTIPQGAKLALVLGSGSHDEATFTDPEQLDLHRPNASNHLAFGKGIHFCIGAPLARLEARIALELFVQRLPGLRLAPGAQIEYVPTLSFRGPKHLLAEWNSPSATTV